MFHCYAPLACPDLELTSEISNIFIYFWKDSFDGGGGVSDHRKPSVYRGDTSQKVAGVHPCLERDSNPQYES
jgi:hypothetical protein